MSEHVNESLHRLPLHDVHVRLGARLCPFAGYEMPVQYAHGIIAEHLHTREKAGLFDVSHMGQAVLSGPGAAEALETLVPGDIVALAAGHTRYTQFLNTEGGILDDLMVTRLDDAFGAPAAPGEENLFLVVNAACKTQDFALLRQRLPSLRLNILEDRALIALQGPRAAATLARLFPGADKAPFMSGGWRAWGGAQFFVTRSGYTGEDGFEISAPLAAVENLTLALLADADVWPIGLGARDTLRLEAGLCLYGHDIDETTSPVEAGLVWSISERRRAAGGFPGAARIQREIAEGPKRKRVGLLLEGKAPAREGAEIRAENGAVVGVVTSGGFAPTLGRPIAMGYVEAGFVRPGAKLDLLVRGRALAASIVPLPFTPRRYFHAAS